jgi:hypothetical protein
MDDRGSRATPARLPRRRRRWRRPHLAGPHLAALVGALGLAVGVAACAGGGNTPSGVASLNGANKPAAAATTTTTGRSRDDRQAAPNFARCMRQHGLNLPDPQVTAGGIDQQPPTGVARDDRAHGGAAGLAGEHAGGHPPARVRAATVDTDGLGSSLAPPGGRPRGAHRGALAGAARVRRPVAPPADSKSA